MRCQWWEQEEPSESRPVHAKFREAVQQLAGASEFYKREAVSFLRGLLQPDPMKRLPVEQALLHPFLAADFPCVAADSMPPKLAVERDSRASTAVEEAALKLYHSLDQLEDDDDDDDDYDMYIAE